MQNNKTSFNKQAKRHQPRGLAILYEDKDIIVVDKTSGLLTISTEKIKDNTAYYRLNLYVRKGNQKSRNQVFIVHRLDSKKFYAVVCGNIALKEGIITSYLTENSAHKVYSVNDPAKGKLAKTGYKVLKESQKYSLLEIALFTGKKNQIRVHFAEKGNPVAGDKVYGKKDVNVKRLMLHSASLTILHPFTKERMIFETEVPPYFKSLINR